MMIPKGYRAREAAALQRKFRGRVDLEVRAQRASVLEPKIHKAIVDTRDEHELTAIFEAAEKQAAEKKVSVTEQIEQPVEQSEQVVSDEQTEQVIDADEAEQTPVDQADDDDATEKSTDAVKADKPAKSKSKNKNK
jgi:hypothetical protein